MSSSPSEPATARLTEVAAPTNRAYSRMMVTGFGAFRGVSRNPSGMLAQASGAPFMVLGVAFAAVDEFLTQLDPSSFDTLIMIGVAAGRDRMTPELFGRNFVGRFPDVTGVDRFGAIDPHGPALLSTTLWEAQVVAGWTMTLPIRSSSDAGNYLCNYISYKALARFPDKRVGFLHVPAEDKLSLDVQSGVLKQILDATST